MGELPTPEALAGGTVTMDEVARRKRLEWLTHCRVVDRRITEINVLEVVPLELD